MAKEDKLGRIHPTYGYKIIHWDNTQSSASNLTAGQVLADLYSISQLNTVKILTLWWECNPPVCLMTQRNVV